MSALLARPAAAPSRGGRPPRRRHSPCSALFHPDSHGSSESGSDRSQRQLGPSLWPEPQQYAAGPLLVQTQRGVPTFQPVVAAKPCSYCEGTGRATCGDCRGKGRLNYRTTAMLPGGVWPQWCASCRATGRWCCPRCMGTGAKRQPIGFRPPEEGEDDDGH